MRNDDRPTQDAPRPYPGRKARGGEIILRSWTQRLVFIGGLVLVVLAIYVAAIVAT